MANPPIFCCRNAVGIRNTLRNASSTARRRVWLSISAADLRVVFNRQAYILLVNLCIVRRPPRTISKKVLAKLRGRRVWLFHRPALCFFCFLSFIECEGSECRIQNDGMALHYLLCFYFTALQCSMPLSFFVTTELVALYSRIEESARTLVVLDVDG